VTVVDALRMKDEFGGGSSLMRSDIGEDDLESLVIQQIEFCNIVLLNKASEVSKEDLGRLREIVRTLQPEAKIIECDWGEVNLDEILDTNLFNFDRTAASATWIKEVEQHIDNPEEDDDDDDDHDHEHHHHHHDEEEAEGEAEEYGIQTFVYYRRRPLDINCFDNFVAKKWPKNIIRAKGICYFTEEFDICYVFEQAGKQISMRNAGQWYATMPDDELREMVLREPGLLLDWDPVYGDRMVKLVFIGQHLDKDFITAELDKCLGE